MARGGPLGEMPLQATVNRQNVGEIEHFLARTFNLGGMSGLLIDDNFVDQSTHNGI